MITLRVLVILVRSLVVLTIGMAGAAVVDTMLTEASHGIVLSISRAK